MGIVTCKKMMDDVSLERDRGGVGWAGRREERLRGEKGAVSLNV